MLGGASRGRRGAGPAGMNGSRWRTSARSIQRSLTVRGIVCGGEPREDAPAIDKARRLMLGHSGGPLELALAVEPAWAGLERAGTVG